jgi:poly(hydroxyalkanoate) granule-associated protein
MAKKIKAVKKVLKADVKLANDKSREIVRAGVGAVSLVRKQGEKIIAKLFKQRNGLQKQAMSFIGNVKGDVQEQANGVLAQVKSAAAANLGWIGDKAEDTMGKVLNRLGVPSKQDVKELSRRVAELHKQVKLMQKAA